MKLQRTRTLVLLALAALPLAAQHGLSKIGDASRLPANVRPPQLIGVGVDEHLGSSVDMNLTFTAENGYPVALGEYFHKGRPVILNLVYYNCPMLCTLVLNGVVDAVKQAGLDAGRDFEVVAISIAPDEEPELARAKKASYLQALGNPAALPRWHFLTGPPESSAAVAEAVGFRYRWDEATRQYAHAAGVFVVTPEGRLSRTFYGVKYAPRDLRLALVDASRGEVGTTMDRVLLACYDWDRSSGRYGLAAMRLVLDNLQAEQARKELKNVGWTKGLELAKLARAEGQRFDCATWMHKAREMPKEEFRREVEKELTGRYTEPHEIIYFKLYKSQIPVVEQAIETAALMLGSDKSRGYCLEMICADFLAGANLDNGNPDTLLRSLFQLVRFLSSEQRQTFLELMLDKKAS